METLDVIRDIITRNIEKGLLPNYSQGIMNIKSQYNTIGVIGIYEALQAYDLTQKMNLGILIIQMRELDLQLKFLKL